MRISDWSSDVCSSDLGVFAVGESAKAAAIAADVYENNIAVITDAEAIGRFDTITEAETFEIEHWSLEQAKLGAAKERGMARRIVAVTGAGGAIGTAIARRFLADGAEVALLEDRKSTRLNSSH